MTDTSIQTWRADVLKYSEQISTCILYLFRWNGQKLLRAVYTSSYVATEYEFLMILMYTTLPPRYFQYLVEFVQSSSHR